MSLSLSSMWNPDRDRDRAAAAARADAAVAQARERAARAEAAAVALERDALADRVADRERELAVADGRVREAAAAAAADRVVAGLVKSRLLCFLHDGAAFDGLLLDVDDRTLTFGAVTLRGDVPVATAAGEMHIDRSRILYMQRVTAEQDASGGGV